MSVWEKSGKEPAALANGPRLPNGCAGLWSDFSQMHERRGSSGFGPSRISFADVDAWQRVRGVQLAAWELDAIHGADNAFLASLPKPKAGE